MKPPRILRIQELVQAVGLSRASIYRLQAHGFPKPIKIGLSAVGWLAEDIERWIQERILASSGVEV